MLRFEKCYVWACFAAGYLEQLLEVRSVEVSQSSRFEGGGDSFELQVGLLDLSGDLVHLEQR